MRCLIYGANGWIGKQVCRLLEKRRISWIAGNARCDDIAGVRTELIGAGHKYTHVICLIGRTHGPGYSTIDYLEQPGKLVDNIRDNLFSPVMLALLCREYGIHLTYMGTGCIFDGRMDEADTGFSEDDKPNFFGSSYSIVKGFTDQIMGYLGDGGILNVRIRMPITDEYGASRNFITKITRYAKICSMDNSMTVLDDLLPVMLDMLEDGKTGTINLVNPGIINHNRILELYREIVDRDFTWINMTLEEQSGILACARSNNKLDTRELEGFIKARYEGLCIDYSIEASIRRCLERMRDSRVGVRVGFDFKTDWASLADKKGAGRELVMMDEPGGFTGNYLLTEPGTPDNVGGSILVTGGCGFIGSHFINFMMDKYRDRVGFRIINLDAMYYCAREENIAGWIRELGDERYKFIRANLRDKTGIETIILREKPDFVIHFAAQTHVDSSFDGDKCLDYTLDNVLGTHSLMEACRVYGACKKIIHVSTDEVYGDSFVAGGQKEDSSILAPTNPYAATKAGAEMIAGSYKHSFGLPIIITRGNNVFGPGQFPEKLIPRWIGLLRAGNKLQVAGDGSQLRNFLWVEDVVRAFDIILEKGTVGDIYNIAGCQEYSVLDVARIMLEEFGVKGDWMSRIEYIPDRPFNDKRYFINHDKLAGLGWKPIVEFRDGLRKLICPGGTGC